MNGFLISESFGQQSYRVNTGHSSVLGITGAWERSVIGERTQLVQWGHAGGDIQITIEDEKQILILLGYVLEIENLPAFKDQGGVSSVLLANMERDNSRARLSALLDRLHGSFGILYYDRVSRMMLCMTDRVASRPIWYGCDNLGWTISSHAVAVALCCDKVKMDPGSVGAFLLYGCPVEPNKSLFSGVKAVPAGTIMRVRDVAHVEMWQWYRFRHVPDNRLPMSGWVEIAAEKMVRSAARIIKYCKEPAIFFSGGVDSRLAAAGIKSAGGNPLLLTLGDGRNLEVRVAELAASSLELAHRLILRDKHYYLRGLRKAVFESGGNFLWTHCHFSGAVVSFYEETGRQQILLGDFLEAFSKLLCSVEGTGNEIWQPGEFYEVFDTLHLPSYRPHDRAAILSLLNRDVRDDVVAAMKRDLMERYERVRTVSNDPLIVADMFLRWECAATAPTFSMFLDLRSVSQERNLMFDKDLQELLEVLPSSIRARGNFGPLIINELQPKAAKVLNSNSLLPVCWPPAVHRFSKKCKPVLGSLRRLMLGRTHQTTGSWQGKEVLYEQDAQWRNYFNEIFRDTALFDEELFDHDAIRQCWRSFCSGNGKLANSVEKMVEIGILGSLVQSTRRQSQTGDLNGRGSQEATRSCV
jgi:hypothetical protein